MSKNRGKSKLSKNVLFNANKHVFHCEKSLGTFFYGQPSYFVKDKLNYKFVLNTRRSVFVTCRITGNWVQNGIVIVTCHITGNWVQNGIVIVTCHITGNWVQNGIVIVTLLETEYRTVLWLSHYWKLSTEQYCGWDASSRTATHKYSMEHHI
jgi:hypothetical protein